MSEDARGHCGHAASAQRQGIGHRLTGGRRLSDSGLHTGAKLPVPSTAPPPGFRATLRVACPEEKNGPLFSASIVQGAGAGTGGARYRVDPSQALVPYPGLVRRRGDAVRCASGDLPVTYVGDGRNNVARTLAVAAVELGLDLRVLAPEPLHPDPASIAELLAGAGSSRAAITVTAAPAEAPAGSAAMLGDVWVSMGEEETDRRIELLRDLKVTPELMARTGRADTVHLRCLPAFHDLETETARARPDLREMADEVFEGPRGRVFDQSENRMHTAKALMQLTIAG
ncbi:hypothetical protein [Embleya scabrispora]|nr:hypothetical protein [Embleya scabrispora]